MKRPFVLLCALLGALCLGSGCATEGGKGVFDEALKDLRGDNMQMRGFGDQPAPARRSE